MYDKQRPRHVFVSHASADQVKALEIVSKLEAATVDCWVAPRNVEPGKSYADALYYAIEAAPVFVLLMSRSANESAHVGRELELAMQMRKRVVPVPIEDFVPTGGFCYYTRAMHQYRWEGNESHVIETIITQVQRSQST